MENLVSYPEGEEDVCEYSDLGRQRRIFRFERRK
jgi:hypothetical protein